MLAEAKSQHSMKGSNLLLARAVGPFNLVV